MSDGSQPTFSCEQCGQSYTWKPELVGRKVRCKCGHVMLAPEPGRPAVSLPAAPKLSAVAPPVQQRPAPSARRTPASTRPAPVSAPARPVAATMKKAATVTAPPPPPPPSHAATHDSSGVGDDLSDDLYALADEMDKVAAGAPVADVPVGGGYRCPGCSSDVPVGTVICGQCGFNYKTGTKGGTTAPKIAHPALATAVPAGGGRGGPIPAALGYAPRRIAQETAVDHVGGSVGRELIVPGALVLGGLVVLTMQHMYDGGSWASLNYALPRVGVNLIVNLVLSFTGMFLLSQVLELSFGAPGPAVLKAAACCVLPPAIAILVGNLLGPDSAYVRMSINAVLMMPLTVACFMLLFEMDFDESAYLSVVIWLVNQWIVMLVLGAMFGGGLGLGIGNTPTTTDQHAAEELTSPHAREARAWLAGDVNNLIGTMGRSEGEALVEEVYGLGAKEVWISTRGSQAPELIVILPKDEAARERIFKWEKDRSKMWLYEPEEDRGQKYLLVEPYWSVGPPPGLAPARPVGVPSGGAGSNGGGDGNDGAYDDEGVYEAVE